MVRPFSTQDVKILERKKGFEGFFSVDVISLRHRRFDGSWSREIQRELFLRGDAVGVLLYDPHNDLIALVEQFRPGALARKNGPWMKEIVAGMLDPGLTPREVAVKECFEEAGLQLTQEAMIPILDFMVSPGGCDERFYLFCALTDLQNIDGIFGLESENEDIRLKAQSYQDVIDELNTGSLDSSATVICLQWLQLNRDKLIDEAVSR